MTDQRHKHRISETTRLNATPLSTHIKTLLTQSKAAPNPDSLTLLELLLWAKANLPLAPEGERMVAQMYEALAGVDDPQAAYRVLAEAEPDLMAAQTTREAAMGMVRSIADHPAARA